MNNENINIPEEDFNEGLEDIEQMLKLQCEFKASDTLKEEALAQAREEVKPQRKVNLWPWGLNARSTYGLGWLLPVWSDLRCCGSHHQRRRKQTQPSMPIWSEPTTWSMQRALVPVLLTG